MSDQPHREPLAGFVPLSEAVKRLGVSDRTIRRRVQAGTLVGEYVARPQGTVLYVKLPDETAGQAAEDAASGGAAASDQEEGATRQDAALTAALETVTGLVADLRALEREHGTLVAQRDAEKARADALTQELEDARAQLDAERQARAAAERRRWWWPF